MNKVQIKRISHWCFRVTSEGIVKLFMTNPIHLDLFSCLSRFRHERNWRQVYLITVDPFWVERTVIKGRSFFKAIEFRSWWLVRSCCVFGSSCFLQDITHVTALFLPFIFEWFIWVQSFINCVDCCVLKDHIAFLCHIINRKPLSFNLLSSLLDKI